MYDTEVLPYGSRCIFLLLKNKTNRNIIKYIVGKWHVLNYNKKVYAVQFCNLPALKQYIREKYDAAIWKKSEIDKSCKWTQNQMHTSL